MMRTSSSLPAAVALLGLAGTARAESGWGLLNMTQGVTAMSRQIYDLHMLMLWVCVAIGVVVFGVMIYSIATFRRSKGAVADTSLVHNTTVEIIWTIVPVFILVACAVPAAKTLIKTEDLRNTQLTIRVTGYQWGWHYEYMNGGVNFFSRLDRQSDAARQLGSGIDPNSVEHYLLNVDNPLVVPVGTKVRLLITANDVIHSWWVPAFGVKKDAIPGFINEAWFDIDSDKPGIYRGQCAELCGRDHGFMPIVVDARTKEDFDAWLKSKAAEQAPKDSGSGPAPSSGAAPAAPAPGAAPAAPASGSAPAATTAVSPAARAALLAATAHR
jgi:cytochrome c oxidase subunit II